MKVKNQYHKRKVGKKDLSTKNLGNIGHIFKKHENSLLFCLCFILLRVISTDFLPELYIAYSLNSQVTFMNEQSLILVSRKYLL